MDGTAPVLTLRDDIRIWNRICDLDRTSVRKSEKNKVKLQNLIKEVTQKENVPPKILCGLMDLADIYLGDDLQSTLYTLLEKCKLSDCIPQIKAAKLLIEKGSYETAGLLLDRITFVTDMPELEYLRGVIDQHNGDNTSALKHFLKVYSLNSAYIPVYTELNNLDPDNGWRFRRNIALANADKQSEPIGNDLPTEGLEELYRAYWEWRHGNIVAALESLSDIKDLSMDDPDVLLAAARITGFDGSYQNSIDYYHQALSDPEGMLTEWLELADICIRSEHAEEAVKICERLETVCPADRRVMETEIRAYAAAQDKNALLECIDRYLFNDYADFDAYSFAVKVMIGLSMNIEASKLITVMSTADPDLPEVLLLSSQNDYMVGRLPQAQISALKAVRRLSDNRECLIHVSKIYLKQGNSKKASKYVEKILKSNPNDLEALILKKDIYKETKQYNEAYALCQDILKKDPRDADVLRDSAMILDALGRHEEALTKYSESLEIRDDPILFTKIITSLTEEQRYEDSINFISKYDDMYGDLICAWVIKGNCEFAISRDRDAILSYQRAIDIDHTDPTIWHSKGMAEENCGLYDEAEISFDKAVLMDLDNPTYWISKASVQQKKGEFAAAIDSLNRVISIHPDNVYALVTKAMILVRLGMVDDALVFIDLALKINPKNNNVLAIKRDIYFHEKDYSKVLDVCATILHTARDDVDTLVIRAKVNIEKHNYDEALNDLVRANEKDPSDMVILALMRDIYNVTDRPDEAKNICRMILKVNPNDRETKVILAESYIHLGLSDAAKTVLEELRSDMPNDTEISMMKAKLIADGDAAFEVLNESLRNDPDNVDLLMEMASLKILTDRSEAFGYLDHAIEVDPSNPDPYIRKAAAMMVAGEYQDVINMLNSAVSSFSYPDPDVWKLIGDAQSKTGDNAGALISYDSAIKLGIDTAEIYRKRGMAQEALGMIDSAKNSYDLACAKDPKETEALERKAQIIMSEGNPTEAGKILDAALNAGLITGSLVLLRARLYALNSDKSGLAKLIYLAENNGLPDEDTSKIYAILNDLEPIVQPSEQYDGTDEHTDLGADAIDPTADTEEAHEEVIVKHAYAVLRVSFETDRPLDDKDVMSEANVPEALVAEVLTYLSDIKEYGEIKIGSSEFRRMEELSYKAVTGSGKTDLEEQPLVPLSAVYFKAGVGSLEEAKSVVAYIYKVMTMDLVPLQFSKEVSDAVNAVGISSSNMSTSEIMTKFSLGVYSARTVMMLSKMKDSVIDHI